MPAAETGFAFMQTWDLERDARELGIALTVARATRLFLGDGFAPVHLLAWSRGGHVG